MAIGKKILILLIICFFSLSSINISYAKNSETISIPISHKMINLDTSETFNFIMEKETEDAPSPKDDTKSIKGNGNESFEVEIGKVGTFKYIIRELEGKNKKNDYDKTIYNVVITSKLNDKGIIETNLSLKNDSGIELQQIEFNDVSNSVAITKPIINNKIKNNNHYNDTFTFKLEGENDAILTNIKGEGKTFFKGLNFNKQGEYTYTISEIKDDKANWKYENKQYKYVVTVTEKNGKLIAKTNRDSFDFTNTPTLMRNTKYIGQFLIKGIKDAISGKNTSDKYVGYACFAGLFALISLIVLSLKKRKK